MKKNQFFDFEFFIYFYFFVKSNNYITGLEGRKKNKFFDVGM